MWPFSSKCETNYCQEMRDALRDYMLQYIKDNPSAGDDVVPIFSDAEVMIRSLSERKISRMMQRNHVNVECGALNILQNFAMTRIQAKPATDFIRSAILQEDENYAFKLYNDINKLKLEKGYISQKQYDDNELLGINLSMQSPLDRM